MAMKIEFGRSLSCNISFDHPAVASQETKAHLGDFWQHRKVVKLFRGMSNSFVSFRRRCIITEMWINPKVTLIVQSKLEWLTPKTTVHKSLSFLWRERILAERNSKSLDKFLERNYYLLCFSILQLNYAINFYVARKKYKQSLKSFDKANFMKTHRLRKMRSVGGKHKEGIFFTKKGVGIQVRSFYYF